MNPDVVLELARMSDIFVPKLAEYFYDPTDRPPAKLYHYTSLDTLGLMLTKGLSSTDDFTFSSWMAGSCLTQNDSQEYGIAGKAFRKYLKINDPGLYESYCKSRDIYWPYIGAHALRAIEKTYAICFSKREDDLSQWLAYGDKGRGVCLEVDSSLLWDIVEEKRLAFTDILYGKKAISKNMDVVLGVCNQLYESDTASVKAKLPRDCFPLAVFDGISSRYWMQIKKLTL